MKIEISRNATFSTHIDSVCLQEVIRLKVNGEKKGQYDSLQHALFSLIAEIAGEPVIVNWTSGEDDV